MVGSGFIQFAPQRPFERPLFVQPATLATVSCTFLSSGTTSLLSTLVVVDQSLGSGPSPFPILTKR